jgi:hypothetical protein
LAFPNFVASFGFANEATFLSVSYVIITITDRNYGFQRSALVLLPGFQKGRDIKASEGKGQGAVLAKKGQFAS